MTSEQSIVVRDRRINGETVSWGVSGQVKDGNLVMYDKKTGSLWLQRTGAALKAELQGQVLEELSESQYDEGIRWDEWLAKHPKTKVLHCEHCLPRIQSHSR